MILLDRVAGLLPAEELGRVRPGTHVEEEERDDKVKPGHLQVCHFHLNLSTHLVLGRGVRVWGACRNRMTFTNEQNDLGFS